MHSDRPPLPHAFCWTRFGPEAGESVDQILARKETERIGGGGIFYWGIGNAVGPGIEALVAAVRDPEVLFSPITTSPRQVDVAPSSTVQWLSGRGLSGEPVEIPRTACVTSRWDAARPNAARYALVCASDEALGLADHGEFRFDALRNLRSSAAVGASQVTAVVRRGEGGTGRRYTVALRAKLVWPFVVRLLAPARILSSARVEIAESAPLQLAI